MHFFPIHAQQIHHPQFVKLAKFQLITPAELSLRWARVSPNLVPHLPVAQ